MTNHAGSTSIQPQPSRFSYGYVILIASFFIFFIVGGTISSFGVFLKPLLTEFDWSRAAVSSAYSLSLVIGGLMGVVAGRISDRFDPRLPLTVGGLFIGAGYLLMTRVSAIWHIHLYYGLLVSIGIGLIPIPLLSLVARWFVKGRGLSSGIIMSGVGVGTVLVPPLANWLISSYSWRTSYLALGTAALVLVIVFAQLLKRPPGSNPAVVQTGAVAKNSPAPPVRGHSLREAVRTPVFWQIIALGFFFFFSAQTVFVHIAAHATDIGFSSAAAAAILSVIGFISIVGTVGGGSLSDMIGSRKTMISVVTLILLSLLGFRFFGALWLLYLCAVVFGLGYGGFSAVQSPFTADFFGLKNLGVFLSFFILAQNIGGGAGSFVGGYIYDVSGSYQWAFMLCAILSAAALLLSLLLKSPRRKMPSG